MRYTRHSKLLNNMKSKIIKKLLIRLLDWVIKLDPEESQEVCLKKAEEIITRLYSTYTPMLEGNKFDRDIFKILFNAKYYDPNDPISPYEKLSIFYTAAKEGHNSFLRHDFFRLLRTNKDKEVKKLLHILDRNTK